MYISFKISFDCPAPAAYRNKRRTDWTKFRRVVSSTLLKNASLSKLCLLSPSDEADPPFECPASLDELSSPEQIEEAVECITDACNTAFSVSCPIVLPKGKRKPHWWTKEIASLRKESRKLFNEAKRNDSWVAYKAALRKFKNATRRAQRNSWKDYCNSIEEQSEGNRLRKVLAKNPTNPTYIQKPNGDWTSSREEMLDVLISAHFPGCTAEPSTAVINTGGLLESADFIDVQRVDWAIKSFHPYKSPGMDGIFPAELQSVSDVLCPLLVLIYKACIKLSFLPKDWKLARVVFIPKGGRPSHVKPSDFRPISLTSFLLKVLERLLDEQIRQEIDPNKLSSCQHAYWKGRSVDTALHCIVSTVEKALAFKEYALGVFLDIEGAFNNVLPEEILAALARLGLGDPLVEFVRRLLGSRTIYSEMGDASVTRYANRGTPQGGVLSPLLWNLAVNTLLSRLQGTGCQVTAYADDLALTAVGKHPQILCDLAQGALRVVDTWCKEAGLSVNPAKTVMVLFSKKRKIAQLKPPSLSGIALSFSEEARYLGVILDRKLTWQRNVEERSKKAMTALYASKSAIGKKWGLKPHIVNWMYTAVVRPILFYGITVWWPSVDSSTVKNKLTKVQRVACMMITGALPSTPTKALETLLHFLPVDLYGKLQASSNAVRLNALTRWSDLSFGHSRILENLPADFRRLDYAVPPTGLRNHFQTRIPSRGEWEDSSVLASYSGTATIYTDGSKLDLKVGSGVYSQELSLSLSFRLPDLCSVFQAELTAIIEAAKCLISYPINLRGVTIFTDSQAAIKSLNCDKSTSKTVMECRRTLNKLARSYVTHVVWVPGHRDIAGNCVADELARKGTLLSEISAAHNEGIPISSCKVWLEKNFIKRANTRWSEELTCRITRHIWPKWDKRRSRPLLCLERPLLRHVIGILTGHCLMGIHATRMGLQSNDFCRSCRDEEEIESLEHYLCHCPALARARQRSFLHYFFECLAELESANVCDFVRFIKATNWFHY